MAKPLQYTVRGVITPLVTPLSSCGQKLDIAGLERLVDHVVMGGVHGIFVLGTTGEGPSLSYELRRDVVQRVCQQANLRIPVVVGITDSSFVESLEMAQCAADAGAAAVVFAPPFYFPIGSAELQEWSTSLADKSPLPVVLYNMPQMTKVSFDLITVKELMEHDNIIGIKDSSGDMAYFHRLLQAAEGRDDWSVLMGPEELLAESVIVGGHGGVSGGSNVFPELFVKLFDAARDENLNEVRSLQRSVAELGEIYRQDGLGGSVTRGIKVALRHLGICSDGCAPPLLPVATVAQQRIQSMIHHLARAMTESRSRAVKAISKDAAQSN